MPALNWNQRFLASTRGQIITLLRRASRTVDELAQALGLTDNAVRAHLATLERDGFVRQRGARRGSGKPAYVYDLSEGAEELFPKAYGPVLRQLLEVLSERMSPEEVQALMHSTGQHLAEKWESSSKDMRRRLQLAVEALNELGGLAELEEHEGKLSIHGYSCPFASIVRDHSEICHLAEALLTELLGAPVCQHCDHGPNPQCHFAIANT